MIVGSLQGDGLQFHAPLEFPIFDVFGFSRNPQSKHRGTAIVFRSSALHWKLAEGGWFKGWGVAVMVPERPPKRSQMACRSSTAGLLEPRHPAASVVQTLTVQP